MYIAYWFVPSAACAKFESILTLRVADELAFIPAQFSFEGMALLHPLSGKYSAHISAYTRPSN